MLNWAWLLRDRRTEGTVGTGCCGSAGCSGAGSLLLPVQVHVAPHTRRETSPRGNQGVATHFCHQDSPLTNKIKSDFVRPQKIGAAVQRYRECAGMVTLRGLSRGCISSPLRHTSKNDNER